MTVDISRLRRHIQLVLGAALAVSVAANIAAAEPTVVGRAVAAWPPLALMLVIDVLGRVPGSDRVAVNRVRLGGAAVVASVAAVASFSHMRHVALAAGESELVAWLFPLTVDGLAVVASIALVELSSQTTTTTAPEPAAAGVVDPVDPVLNGPGSAVAPTHDSVPPLPAQDSVPPLPAPLVPVRF